MIQKDKEKKNIYIISSKQSKADKCSSHQDSIREREGITVKGERERWRSEKDNRRRPF